MSDTYTTKQNQTWDMIAREVYGKEKYAGYLMQNNPEKIEIFMFGAGTILKTPELEDDETAIEVPDWRK